MKRTNATKQQWINITKEQIARQFGREYIALPDIQAQWNPPTGALRYIVTSEFQGNEAIATYVGEVGLSSGLGLHFYEKHSSAFRFNAISDALESPYVTLSAGHDMYFGACRDLNAGEELTNNYGPGYQRRAHVSWRIPDLTVYFKNVVAVVQQKSYSRSDIRLIRDALFNYAPVARLRGVLTKDGFELLARSARENVVAMDPLFKVPDPHLTKWLLAKESVEDNIECINRLVSVCELNESLKSLIAPPGEFNFMLYEMFQHHCVKSKKEMDLSKDMINELCDFASKYYDVGFQVFFQTHFPSENGKSLPLSPELTFTALMQQEHALNIYLEGVKFVIKHRPTQLQSHVNRNFRSIDLLRVYRALVRKNLQAVGSPYFYYAFSSFMKTLCGFKKPGMCIIPTRPQSEVWGKINSEETGLLREAKNHAAALFKSKDYSSSLKTYQDIHEACTQPDVDLCAGSKELLLAVISNIALLLHKKGDTHQAYSFCLKGISLYRELNPGASLPPLSKGKRLSVIQKLVNRAGRLNKAMPSCNPLHAALQANDACLQSVDGFLAPS